MTVRFRNYPADTGYHEDYHAVCDFLHRTTCNEERVSLMDWVFWEWQAARGAYKADFLGKIGMWEYDGTLVAATPYEDHENAVALCADREHRPLLSEMLEYVCAHMAHEGFVRLIIDDGDVELEQLARQHGFLPTQSNEPIARLDITNESTRYELPDGFRVTSFNVEFDVRRYNRVMWYGFNHGPEAPQEDEEALRWRMNCVSSPNARRSLMTVTVAPNGDYASHCTMWYRGGDNAIVEPVATHPDYRRMGLGRAAVLEAARRCGELGAKRAFVGSSQPFYYGIGFYPMGRVTVWAKKA